MAETETSRSNEARPGRWKWLVVALLLLAICVGLIPAIRSSHARREIDSRLASYRAKGEPASVADLCTPAAMPGDNAVADLQAAAAKVVTTSDAWKEYNGGESYEGLSPKQRAELRATIAKENAPAIALVDVARRKKGFCWPQPTSPLILQSMANMSPQRMLANAIGWSAMADHDRGDDAEALRQIDRLFFQAGAIERYPSGSLVPHLVAMGIRALAADRATQFASDLKVGEGGASREQVTHLISVLLDDSRFDAAFRTAMQHERVEAVDSIDSVLNGTMSDPAGGSGSGGWFNPRVYIAKPKLLGDVVLVLDSYTAFADLAVEPDWPTAHKKRDAIVKPIESGSHPYAGLVVPAMTASVQNHFRCRTDQRLAAVALSIRLYAVDHHGDLPANLDALVPAYLPAVPRDPMAEGAPALRYLPGGADPRIYSVGDNGKDDGGSDKPTRASGHPGDQWACADAVVHLKSK